MPDGRSLVCDRMPTFPALGDVMSKLRLQPGSILGTFGKGVDGSVSINFSVSGGDNCDTACVHHPQSTANNATFACYAARSEIRPDRAQLAAKLTRHERMPAALVCGKALLELQELLRRRKRIPWVRISTNGSLPQIDDVRGNKLFRSQFRALLSFCKDNAIPIHIPVETYAKARFYRSLLGDLATIRESVQRLGRFTSASGAVSVVAGAKSESRIERVEIARQVARERREATGRKCIVCPAVLNGFAARRDRSLLNINAKCGNCTACANSLVDIVYPLH